MLNRRDFLKLAGITLGSTAFEWHFPISAEQQGRILQRIAVQPTGEILLPDAVYPIKSVSGGWVRLPMGYLPQQAIQPMLPAHQQPFTDFPTWAEVSAPYAAIRTYADGQAPLLARPGHGAVFRVQRSLGQWLEVAVNEQSGWVQSRQLEPIPAPSQATATHALIEGSRLILYQGDQVMLQTSIVRPADLATGDHYIAQFIPSFSNPAKTNPTPSPLPMHGEGIQGRGWGYAGIPWNLITDRGVWLHGVYWHHHFDRIADQPQLELPLIAARMMFSLFSSDSYLSIR